MSVLACAALTATSNVVSAKQPRSQGPAVVSGSARLNNGVLRTGADSAIVEFPTNARIELGPGSELRVFPVAQKLQLSPGAPSTVWTVALARGRVDVSVQKQPSNAIVVNVGKLSALVSDGTAAMLVGPGEQTVSN